MAETRRTMVTIIRQGDPEIAGALVAGIAAGRGEAERRGGDLFRHGWRRAT